MKIKRWSYPIFAACTYVGLSLFALTQMYTVWWFVLTFWFGTFAVQYFRGIPKLPVPVLRFHQVCVLTFPVVTTLVKWFAFRTGQYESVGLSNRVQHVSWALAQCGLLAPLLWRWVRNLQWIPGLVMIVGVISVFGNLNEVGEWTRGMGTMTDAYGDTVKDLVMNIIGSTAGAVFLLRLAPSDRRAEILR